MIEKFRIQDGKFLGEAFEGRPEEQPEWAKRFLQKGYVEGTYVQ